MAIFHCSMFGHVVYDDKLTYQELLDTETRVTAVMHKALEECGAQHIDFTPQADAMLMECLFSDMDRDQERALCASVIRQLGPGVLARFLFVDRRMDSVVFYFLGRGKWQEQALSVPAPREALAGWVVRQERKPVRARRAPENPAESSAGENAAQPGRADGPGRAPDAPGKRSGRKRGTDR